MLQGIGTAMSRQEHNQASGIWALEIPWIRGCLITFRHSASGLRSAWLKLIDFQMCWLVCATWDQDEVQNHACIKPMGKLV